MNELLAHEPGATPLSPDDLQGLIPTYITTRAQLNEAEQANIVKIVDWALSRRRKLPIILTEDFVFRLHRRMFSDVWRWAGKQRESNTNIGVDYWTIQVEVRNLVEDAKVWHQHKTYQTDEFAIRLKHRMVSIHPFRNGNGRHSRMIADAIVTNLGGEPFTWGRGNITNPGEARNRYLQALREADNHDIGPLLAFSRS